MILSALVHPWFYILGAMYGFRDHYTPPTWGMLQWACSLNLAAGYGAAWLLTIVTAVRLRPSGRARSVIWLPVYWLAISFAAYRAVLDLIFRPFYWEKTAHGVALASAEPRKKGRTRPRSDIAQTPRHG
jgi:hypothetical protein